MSFVLLCNYYWKLSHSQRVSREYAILHKGSDSLGLEGMLEFYPSEGEMDKPVKALSMSSLLKVEKTKETQRKKHPFVVRI